MIFNNLTQLIFNMISTEPLLLPLYTAK